jgi:hypothetical protein
VTDDENGVKKRVWSSLIFTFFGEGLVDYTFRSLARIGMATFVDVVALSEDFGGAFRKGCGASRGFFRAGKN